MNKIRKRECIICRTEFNYNTNSHHNYRKNFRPKSSMTCSRECSIVYQRVYRYLLNKWKREVKKNE